ncbi:hypothetical protein M5689_023419 [Euphorbia peplus]|nr:hypothetical protein M5689_023419 [Euphorbia peplus]
MKKLSRNWQNSLDDKSSLPISDEDSRPMDTQEQEELIRSLESTQAQQSLLWRRVFAVFLGCYAVFLLFSIYQQATSPWDLRFYAYFMEDLDSWMVISAGWLAILACSMAVLGLVHDSKHHRQWIWRSCSVGLVLAGFWLYFMLRLSKFRWDILWLPFGPLCAASLCLYVDHLLSESSEEVRKLRGYMYAFKAN